MSGSSGTIDVEDLVEDLTDSAERVELTALHLVQQPAQLRIVRDRALQMPLRASGRDREYLAREVAPPPLVEAPGVDEEGAVLADLLPQLRHAFVSHRLGEHDRRP